jgi:hypothetical protein
MTKTRIAARVMPIIVGRAREGCGVVSAEVVAAAVDVVVVVAMVVRVVVVVAATLVENAEVKASVEVAADSMRIAAAEGSGASEPAVMRFVYECMISVP